MEDLGFHTGDVVRRYTGELLYIHGTGLTAYYATFIESGEPMNILRKVSYELYKLANEEVEAAAQESCTTDCLAYCQGICPYIAKRKAFCPRVKALLVDLEG